MSSHYEYILTNFPAFNFVGLSIRTSNTTADVDIAALWDKFFKENWIDKIKGRMDDDVLGLYFNYEGDFTKPYHFAIGCRVENLIKVSEDLIALNIPAANYAEFVAHGKMPDCIIDTWIKIWNSDVVRSYCFDFEVYPQSSFDPKNALVPVFIGIK
ncbi:GyrI-like domain-containing protein [Solitalea koreensis]|uniref:Predicted transcriptional regulator YdeE, contains AraC-type DNA-binding domain n=1 Tax=Solitalea koreensis TaxID=543615 RepID=A0A521BL78_9SPHI|nr:GyrI-like domain-containing protein [Solitalea koreensis]SMO47849.1 Predicted transcriptional regulator YdeE, contains AraC-type DNA-binding domain [Solitalea koreensis]